MLKINSDVAVIVPTFNEGGVLENTVLQLSQYFENIYVVDDGSLNHVENSEQKSYFTCLRHILNLGQGAAIQTGIEYALENESIRYFLTFDADGQHSIKSALGVLEEIKECGVDIVIGSRFIGDAQNKTMPTKKKFILKLAIWFTRMDSKLPVTDTHNGLRVMSRNFVENLKIRNAGMAHASEILRHIKDSGSTWKEFPVEITYSEYSIKKGQSILNAVNILTEMIHK